jgi:hypothetical protein
MQRCIADFPSFESTYRFRLKWPRNPNHISVADSSVTDFYALFVFVVTLQMMDKKMG